MQADVPAIGCNTDLIQYEPLLYTTACCNFVCFLFVLPLPGVETQIAAEYVRHLAARWRVKGFA